MALWSNRTGPTQHTTSLPHTTPHMYRSHPLRGREMVTLAQRPRLDQYRPRYIFRALSHHHQAFHAQALLRLFPLHVLGSMALHKWTLLASSTSCVATQIYLLTTDLSYRLQATKAVSQTAMRALHALVSSGIKATATSKLEAMAKVQASGPISRM